jgi:hypothetical protein
MAKTSGDPVARVVHLVAGAVLPGLENDYGPTRNVYAHGGMPRLRPDQEQAVNDLNKRSSQMITAHRNDEG